MLPRAGIRLYPAGRAELGAAYCWVVPPSELPKPTPTQSALGSTSSEDPKAQIKEKLRPYGGLLSSL